ncbi:hypothetical protein F3Y22_tig00111960pilonHSYRG00001 [Hibiscus syriacus]|uniref:BIRD-IDD transcription factor second C2H2 zinc finger domain-containing protein n=1 Tax=Hibiscus syriacus TaxID=106335 RepID=A0A6A2YD72_HIBSY|nr:hypothetical protein F3Y22_tig00111960pilonHSYRG00001 [Hibiscus syriacus]
MVEFENSSPVTVSVASGEATASSFSNQIQDTQLLGGPPLKKKEIFLGCQNLQLHRRGHNLPWKLRQRTSKEIQKRVYVCPEPSCVHHNPARALGDLTAEESARAQTLAVVNTEGNVNANENGRTMVGGGAAATATAAATEPNKCGFWVHEQAENPMALSPATSAAASTSTSNANVFVSMFAANSQPSKISAPSSFLQATTLFERTSLSLSSPLYLSNNGSSIFTGLANDHCHYALTPQPAMSASTAAKSCSNGCRCIKPLPCFVVWAWSYHRFLPLGSSSLFGNKRTTLDLLGLGMSDGEASSSGLSALLTSFGGGFNVGAVSATSFGAGGSSNSPRETWDGAPERKPNGSAML